VGRLGEGKMKKEDLLGQKFGRLMVVGAAEPVGKRKRAAWLCRCECGVEKVIRAENLKDGSTKSCGCLNDEKRSERAATMYGACIKYHPSETSARAVWRRRYSDGRLSFEDFMRISQMNCDYCGSTPNNIANAATSDKKSSQYARDNGDFKYNGLDRVDSTKPHTLENVVPCCFPCNIAKHDMSLEDFRSWIIRVVKHLVKKKIIALGDLFA
jgi:hypothetical protein